MISVGIDVSKDKHDCFIVNSEGEVLADVFTIHNTMDVQLPFAENPRVYHATGQNKSRA